MKRTLSESDLAMPRRKRRSLVISLAYRLVRAARALFGAKRVLRFFLDGAWLCWRFAFELASDIYDAEFQRTARGVSDELLREVIPPNGTVLDAGCGPGHWSRTAAQYAAQVTGVDYSRASIEEARRATTAANVEYIAGDLHDVLGGRKFDVALLIHVIEHIEDIDAFLRLVAGVASTLIIEVPSFEADLLNPVRHEMRSRFYSDADHVREYTPEILREQLVRNGLEVERLELNRASIVAVARGNAGVPPAGPQASRLRGGEDAA